MMDHARAEREEGQPTFPLEERVRLSESFLWGRQRRFYESAGASAWEGDVPLRITSTRVLAAAYVEVFVAWLRDLRSPAGGGLDEAHPIYIVELGAGPGRFAFHFLRQLPGVIARYQELSGLRIIYVMTDVAERNLTFTSSHPAFAPFLAQGQVDFGRFDVEQPESLRLERSGVTLCPSAAVNPITCIANYLCDTVRQDLFAIGGGRLGETRISVRSSQPEEDLDEPNLMRRVTIDFDTSPVFGAYYGDADLDHILEQYAAELPDVGFLFPLAALRVLRYLSRLSSGRMLFLGADKGYDRLDLLMEQGGPGIALHGGGFSFMVNFEAIGRLSSRYGGHMLRVNHRDTSLCTVACVFGLPKDATPSTNAAFAANVVEFGPDQYFALETALSRHATSLTTEEILAWLRLSRFDPGSLMLAAGGLEAQLPAAPQSVREDVRDAILRSWGEYYHLGERPDAAAIFGRLLLLMRYFQEALVLFERSLELSGPDSATLHLMGMAAYGLGRLDLARRCAAEALQLAPDNANARSLLRKLEADESRH